jgi:hypothetical protein
MVIVSQLSLLFGELKAVTAAHSFLQIVSSFPVRVFDDRHHVLVIAPHEFVAGRDENLHVVDLGARLVEALFKVV